MVTGLDLIKEAKILCEPCKYLPCRNPEYLDICGVAQKAFPYDIDKMTKMQLTADFIVSDKQMWFDVNSQEIESLENFDSFIEDKTPRDYLETFTKYLELWASRKHESSDEENWYKAQEEYAQRLIGLTYSQNDEKLDEILRQRKVDN